MIPWISHWGLCDDPWGRCDHQTQVFRHKGRHAIDKHPDGTKVFVPRHSGKDLKPGTLSGWLTYSYGTEKYWRSFTAYSVGLPDCAVRFLWGGYREKRARWMVYQRTGINSDPWTTYLVWSHHTVWDWKINRDIDTRVDCSTSFSGITAKIWIGTQSFTRRSCILFRMESWISWEH